jgi:hypothetical protein
MDCKIVNPSNGRSGGILLLWKKEIKIKMIFSAPKYIDVKVSESVDKIWRLNGFYGEPRWEDRHLAWDKIHELHNSFDLPWVIIGDFNEILFSHEKEGGNPRPQIMMQNFRDALADCNLEDLGYSGDPFTWRRGRIKEHLDRCLANNSWNVMHPGALVQHLNYIRSDHRPILLDTEYKQIEQNQRIGPVRFEAKWLREKGFRELVEKEWEKVTSSAHDEGVLAKLSTLHSALHAWDREVLKQPKRRLRKAQRDLENALSGPMSDENDAIAKEMATLVELLLEQEEVY